MERSDGTSQGSISFELPAEQSAALQAGAAGRQVRVTGGVKDGRLVVKPGSVSEGELPSPLFVAVNAPFKTAQASDTEP